MTDPEFVDILRISDDVSKRYAADRIEALAQENERLHDEYAQVAELVYGEAEHDHDGVTARVAGTLEELDNFRADLVTLRAQLAERGNQARKMLAALKIIPVVMRPWIDAQIGHGGTVSFEEWEAAMKQIDAALEAEATQETR